MADYYPLIARAISGLDPNASGESRRALYERARTALISQLRSVEPALTEAEITRERLALEEAVRKVEAEAVQRQRSAQRPDQPPSRPEPPRSRPPEGSHREGPRPGDALRDSARAAAARMAAAGNAHRSQPPAGPGDRIPRNLRVETQHDLHDRPHDQRPDQKQDQRQDSWEDIARARDNRPGGPRPPGGPRGPGAPGQGTRGFRDVVADANDLGNAAAQANRAARRTYSKVPSPSPEFDRLEPGMEQRGAEQPGYTPPLDDEETPVRAGRRFPLKAAVIVGVLLMLIGGGFWAAPKILPLLKSKPVEQATTPAQNGNAVQPKITDRVGQPGSSQQIAPVAQRAILYEEDPSDPQGKQSVGTVVWRNDQIAASSKQKPDTAIRADIEIPDRKMKVTVTILRNTDPAMPATSHTIEVVFTVPPDFGTTIANVPGIYAKSPDQPRGTPLAATSVKVQDGYFLIGLSNVETDRARNIQVLKERSSLDIPMVYGNGKRAILSIEKGPPGERVFNDAFAAWGQ